MLRYKVYFEIYGKKLRTTIEARSKDHAQEIIRDKVIFHKIEREGVTIPGDLLDMFFGKKTR